MSNRILGVAGCALYTMVVRRTRALLSLLDSKKQLTNSMAQRLPQY